MKTFATIASIAAVMAAPAFAQEATTPSTQTPPAATAPAPMPAATLSAGDVSAKELLRLSVKNAANETVGDINDVMIGKDGKISAVIVGVGGFLGLGEKNVALPFEELTLATDTNGKLAASTSATKESLQSAPEYVKPKNHS